jgi:hypothetical protein
MNPIVVGLDGSEGRRPSRQREFPTVPSWSRPTPSLPSSGPPTVMART